MLTRHKRRASFVNKASDRSPEETATKINLLQVEPSSTQKLVSFNDLESREKESFQKMGGAGTQIKSKHGA
jgi:hypothetical protein